MAFLHVHSLYATQPHLPYGWRATKHDAACWWALNGTPLPSSHLLSVHHVLRLVVGLLHCRHRLHLFLHRRGLLYLSSLTDPLHGIVCAECVSRVNVNFVPFKRSVPFGLAQVRQCVCAIARAHFGIFKSRTIHAV